MTEEMPFPVPIGTSSWSDWNPSLYMKFVDVRTRAARDLLARVPLDSARLVYDLGCGPGNSSELLARRFPEADLTGVDTSDAMLAHARLRAPKATFVRLSIADWTPDAPPNLIFSNAALHFLPDHHKLIPRLAESLAPGGVFAAQMPSTANESSHALMRMVAAEGPWSSRLVRVAKTQPLIAALDRQRILARAHAHGRRRGPVVVAARAGGQNAAADRRPRRLLRMAAADLVRDRAVDDHVCLHVRQCGGGCGLFRRLRPAAVPRAAERRRALRLPQPLSRRPAGSLSGAVRRKGAAALPAPVPSRGPSVNARLSLLERGAVYALALGRRGKQQPAGGTRRQRP